MALMFTQGYKVTGKLELVQSSVVKLSEAAQMFMMFEYVSWMSVKSCMYGDMDCLGICSFCFYH